MKLLLLLLLQAQTVCIGDSVTRSTPYVKFGEGYCELLGGINAGVGGQTAVQGLERFKRDVLSHHPKRVIIMFGLNDAPNGVSLATYKLSLKRMILMAGKRKVVLMTPNPYWNNHARNRELLPYVHAVREIAKSKKLRLVDNYAHFAELGLIDELGSYYADDLHPNAFGHQEIIKAVKQ